MRNVFLFLLAIAGLLFLSIQVSAQEPEPGSDTLARYLEILEKDPEDKVALKAIGFHYMSLGHDAKAVEFGERLLEIARKTGDRDYAELWGLIIVSASNISGDDDRKLRQLSQALSIAERNNNREALVSIYNGLGIYYSLRFNDPYVSIEYYQRALEEAKATNDLRRYAIILSNLSSQFISKNDPAGLEVAKEAHAIALERNEPDPLYYSKQALAWYYVQNDSIAQTKRLIAEIEEMVNKQGFFGNADLSLLKAKVFRKEGRPDLAEKEYLSIPANLKDVHISTKLEYYLDYASFMRQTGRISEAQEIINMALADKEVDNIAIHDIPLYKELSKIHRTQGNWPEAINDLEKVLALADTVYQSDRERMVQDAKTRNDVYLHEMKIAQQEEELKAERTRRIWLAAGAFLLLTMAFVYILWQRRRHTLLNAIVSQNTASLEREHALMRRIEELTAERNECCAFRDSEIMKRDRENERGDARMRELADAFLTLLTERKLHRDPSLNLAMAAEALETNRTYLSRAINERFGKSFTQIINEHRIHDAVAILSGKEGDDVPIKQLAGIVGFNSMSTFYTIFQQLTALTPAAYRSQAKTVRL